jgi:hypothetical protein
MLVLLHYYCFPINKLLIFKIVVLEKALEAERQSKPQPEPQPEPQQPEANKGKKPTTCKEVLASIPNFKGGRPRKRLNRKLSTAEQIEQSKNEGTIDLHSPHSIIAQVDLKKFLNKKSFDLLPAFYQHKLVHLLPEVDVRGPDESLRYLLIQIVV